MLEFSLGDKAVRGYKTQVMTRTSIEFAAKIYIVSLIIVFCWTVTKVLAQLGWM